MVLVKLTNASLTNLCFYYELGSFTRRKAGFGSEKKYLDPYSGNLLIKWAQA